MKNRRERQRERLEPDLRAVAFRVFQRSGVERTPDQLWEFVVKAYDAPSALIRLAASESSRANAALEEIARDLRSEGIDDDVAEALGED